MSELRKALDVARVISRDERTSLHGWAQIVTEDRLAIVAWLRDPMRVTEWVSSGEADNGIGFEEWALETLEVAIRSASGEETER